MRSHSRQVRRNRRGLLLVVAALVPLVVVLGFAVMQQRLDVPRNASAADPAAQGQVQQSQTPTPTPVPPPMSRPFDLQIKSHLATAMGGHTELNSGFSAVVIDAATGGQVWGFQEHQPRMPASTRKAMVAFVVLKSLPVERQLVTQVLSDPAQPSSITLRGDGDPTLSPLRVDELARQVAAWANTSNLEALSVRTDSTLFPQPRAPTPDTPAAQVATDLAHGWDPAYLAGQVQLPRGLTMVDYRGYSAEQATGEQFIKALKAAGVNATYSGQLAQPATQANPQLRQVAQSRSETVGRLVDIMLARSNNDYAEFLFRHAAVARGYEADWQGALANEKDLLQQVGIDISGAHFSDASGLSRTNAIPPAVMAQVIRQLWLDPLLRAATFADQAMPVGGMTGTLRNWFRDSTNQCAAGKVRAKTGNLRDVLSLAGVASGSDRNDRIFVYLDNNADASRDQVRQVIQTLTTAAVGCRFDGQPASPTPTALNSTSAATTAG